MPIAKVFVSESFTTKDKEKCIESEHWVYGFEEQPGASY